MTELPPDELAALYAKHAYFGGASVCELGNKKNVTGLYRDWYVARGATYTCIDWNGEDGARRWDMRLALPDELIAEWGGPFDLVTNFGFTEHVTEQEPVWENIHRLMKVGGWCSVCLPTPPRWESHGYWQPNENWIRRLCDRNGYGVHFVSYWMARVRPTVIARYQRSVAASFSWPGDEGLHRTRTPFSPRDLQRDA